MDGFCVFCLTICGSAVILFFPISLTGYIHIDPAHGKLYYSAALYGKIVLSSGYIELRREGLAVHSGKYKAIVLSYSGLLKTKPDLNKLWRFRLRSVDQICEAGVGSGLSLVVAIVFRTAGAVAGTIASNYGCGIRSDVLLSSGRRFQYSACLKVQFDLLAVLVLCVKMVLEELMGWKKKIKSKV